MQKTKWLSGEALQIAVKRREAKSKGEKERDKHLNAEFCCSPASSESRDTLRMNGVDEQKNDTGRPSFSAQGP